MGKVLHGSEGHGRCGAHDGAQQGKALLQGLNGGIRTLQGKIGAAHAVQSQGAAEVIAGIPRNKRFKRFNALLRLALFHQIKGRAQFIKPLALCGHRQLLME